MEFSCDTDPRISSWARSLHRGERGQKCFRGSGFGASRSYIGSTNIELQMCRKRFLVEGIHEEAAVTRRTGRLARFDFGEATRMADVIKILKEAEILS